MRFRGCDSSQCRRDFLHPLLAAGELWLWQIKSPSQVTRCRAMKSQREHARHRRKYAEGQLPA